MFQNLIWYQVNTHGFFIFGFAYKFFYFIVWNVTVNHIISFRGIFLYITVSFKNLVITLFIVM